jgi:hypothetical protein
MAIDRKMKNGLVVTGALLMFFGTPVLGLNYFWNDMHQKIEKNGLQPAGDALSRVITQGYEYIETQGTPRLRTGMTEEKFSAMGGLKSFSGLKPVKSWARQMGSKDMEQMYQFARYKGEGVTDKGPVEVEIVICRLYLEPAWLVDDIIYRPLAVGVGR